MASLTITSYCFSTSFTWINSNKSQTFPISKSLSILKTSNHSSSRFCSSNSRITLEEKDPSTPLLLQEEDEPDDTGVEESVKVLKNAAKSRKVASEEVLAALSVIKKSKLDPSLFLNKLGGKESPGRTWMLIFTAQDRLKRGSYFPITAVQRFDAAAKMIENGVYLGPIGWLKFQGRFSWKKRVLAFIFEFVEIKFGPFSPLRISLGQKDEREPGTKDPFFTWFYVDEEIAVAQGRGGGTAFWCRCRRVM